MKPLLILLSFVFLAACNPTSNDGGENDVDLEALGLPELHEIYTHDFAFPYSCPDEESDLEGYEGAALFLSAYSHGKNAPELLYNNACGDSPRFEINFAGDDMGMIADLGPVELETLTSREWTGSDDSGDYDFHVGAEVMEGHSYSVMIARDNLRAQYFFQVDEFEADGEMTIRYAVKLYEVFDRKAEAEGFDWEETSQ